MELSVVVLSAVTPTVWLVMILLVKKTLLAERMWTPLPSPPLLRAMVVCQNEGEDS